MLILSISQIITYNVQYNVNTWGQLYKAWMTHLVDTVEFMKQSDIV